MTDQWDTLLLVGIVGVSCFIMPILIAVITFRRKRKRKQDEFYGE